MKKNVLVICLSALCLSGCRFSRGESIEEANFVTKSIKACTFIDKGENPSFSDMQYKTTNLHYLNDHPDIPYLSFNDYVDLISNRVLKEGRIEIANYSSKINIKGYAGDSICYFGNIDLLEKTYEYAGNLSRVMIQPDYSTTSLTYGLQMDEHMMKSGAMSHVATYAKTSYKPYSYEGKLYFPLSFFESSFSDEVGAHLIYTHKDIFQYDDVESLTASFINEEGRTSTIYEEIEKNKSLIKNKNDVIQDRKNAFYYIMDSFYGLGTVKGISSMADYFKNSKYASGFDSLDDEKRTEAFYGALASLDDGHTAVSNITASCPWTSGSYPRYGDLWINRIQLRSDLSKAREYMYGEYGAKVGDVVYSNDGSLAYYSFDEFTFVYDAFDGSGKLKEEVYEKDTFFKMVRAFDQMAAKGTVKDVVIDISCNGGGVLGVMFKLLAILSSNNSADCYIGYNDIGLIAKETINADSNCDGEYDEYDAYGNKFNFHILTSDFSFSCGNAYPFFASRNGSAEIIGHNSGGGECSVIQHVLPTGEVFNHSSLMHMGWYQNQKWQGDEIGAGVSKDIAYENFYDIEYLDSLLSA